MSSRSWPKWGTDGGRHRHELLLLSAAREPGRSCRRGAEPQRQKRLRRVGERPKVWLDTSAGGPACRDAPKAWRAAWRTPWCLCGAHAAAARSRGRGRAAAAARHEPHRPTARCARHQSPHARYMARTATRHVQCAVQAAQRRQPGPGARAAAAAPLGWQHAFRNAAHRAVAPRRSPPRAYTGLEDAVGSAL